MYDVTYLVTFENGHRFYTLGATTNEQVARKIFDENQFLVVDVEYACRLTFAAHSNKDGERVALLGELKSIVWDML